MTAALCALGYFVVGVLFARALAADVDRYLEYAVCLLWPLVAYAALGALVVAARSPEDPAFCEAYGTWEEERPRLWAEARAAGFAARWKFATYHGLDFLAVMWWPVVLPFAVFAAAYDFLAPSPHA